MGVTILRQRPNPGCSCGCYTAWLRGIVARPVLAVGVAVLLAASTWALFRSIGTGFLPPADEGGFVVDYLTPAGSALGETDRQVRAMERVIADTPEVAAYSRRTGSELGLFATAQNTGDILVRLKPRAERDLTSEEVIAALRPRLQQAAPLAEIEFVQLLQDMLGDLEGSPTPIEVKIFGDDTAVLETLSEPVEAMLEKVDGVVDVVGMQRGNPEMTWTVDPVAAGRLGLTVEQVSAQLSAAWLGEVATDLRLFDRRVPVRVRLPDAVRFDVARLADTLLRTPAGALVPVSRVARAERSNGQAELLRENLRGMALVSGRLEGRDLGSAVAEIRTALQTLTLPVGYTYEIGGQYESQRTAFRELLAVFGVAAVLVFTILVVHFRAWTPAILILLAAPLSLGGALLLLLPHRRRSQRLLGHGPHPAGRAGGEERHHAARPVGIAARRRRAVRVGDRARRRHPPAADPHDHALHALRAAAARARARSRRRPAEAARARGHRRTRAVDAGHAAGRAGAVCGLHPSTHVGQSFSSASRARPLP